MRNGGKEHGSHLLRDFLELFDPRDVTTDGDYLISTSDQTGFHLDVPFGVLCSEYAIYLPLLLGQVQSSMVRHATAIF
jgi:hypothetical protein